MFLKFLKNKFYKNNKNSAARITLENNILHYDVPDDKKCGKGEKITLPLKPECAFNSEFIRPEMLYDEFKFLAEKSARPVIIILPEKNVVIRDINYPDMPLSEARQALGLELDNYFPELKKYSPYNDNKLNAENTVYDIIRKPDGGVTRFTAAATNAGLIGGMLNAAENAGLHVSAVTPAPDLNFDLRTHEYAVREQRRNAFTFSKIIFMAALLFFLTANIFYIISAHRMAAELDNLIDIQSQKFNHELDAQKALLDEIKILNQRYENFEEIFNIIQAQPPVLETLKMLEANITDGILIYSIRFSMDAAMQIYRADINAFSRHDDSVINMLENLNASAPDFNLKKLSVPSFVKGGKSGVKDMGGWKEFNITLFF